MGPNRNPHRSIKRTEGYVIVSTLWNLQSLLVPAGVQWKTDHFPTLHRPFRYTYSENFQSEQYIQNMLYKILSQYQIKFSLQKQFVQL